MTTRGAWPAALTRTGTHERFGMKYACIRCGLESDEKFTWAHGPKDSDIRTCGGTVVPEDEVDETREDEDGEWQALKAGRIWNPTKGQA